MADSPHVSVVAPLATGLPAVGIFVFFAGADGGFHPTVWLPAALFLLGLLAITVWALPSLVAEVPREVAAAMTLIAGFSIWSYLSIFWADAKGDAWDGANRTFLYLVVYALFALWSWRPATAGIILGAFSFGVAAIAGIAFVRVTEADRPLDAFIDGLFVEPVGYHNANVALLLLAFWPALFLASRRETPLPARAIGLAAAGLCLELGLLSQSRGSLFVAPVALAIYLALVPGRTRSVLALVPIVVAALLSLDPILDVYGAARAGDPRAALGDARAAMGLSVAALFLTGIALAVIDRRVRIPRRVVRYAGVTIATAAAVGLVTSLIALAPSDPASRLSSAWSDFKRYDPEARASTHFSSGLGSNRYDFWRVALGEFTNAPLHGIGADNFAIPYVRERKSDEEPLYPHSLEVQVLSQTGVVGAALIAGFFLSALLAALKAQRLSTSFGAGVAGGAIVTFAYWFGHASGDWLWEFPALTAPALGFLGLAGGLGRRGVERPRFAGGARNALTAAGAAAVLAAAVSLLLPWFAAKEVEAAGSSWRDDPPAAFSRLERAGRLNPVDDRPDLVAGAIASRLGDWSRMRSSFERALARNPKSWYAELELGLVHAVEGRNREALLHLRRAQELNPTEPAVRIVQSQIRAGRPVVPGAIDRLLLERAEERTN